MRYSVDQRIFVTDRVLSFSMIKSAKISLDLETLAQLDQSYDDDETQANEMYWDCEPSFIQLGDPIQISGHDLESGIHGRVGQKPMSTN